MNDSWSRFSKTAVLVGATVAILGLMLGMMAGMDSTHPLYEMTAVVRFIGIVALGMGLPGVYQTLSRQVAKMALFGFIFLFAYLFLWAAEEAQIAVVYGLLDQVPAEIMQDGAVKHLAFMMSNFLTLLLGGIPLGIALGRSSFPAKRAGWVILTGAVGTVVGRFANFAGIAWLDPIMHALLVGGLLWAASGIGATEAEAPRTQ